jgi:hypothetical protein
VCCAETVTRLPGEDAATFAQRHAPAHSAEVVKVVESTAWNFAAPAVVAFYKRQVAFADKRLNYGTEPNDYEVIGLLFAPTSTERYETIEIDSYGPEGSTAEIGRVSISRRGKAAGPLLFVEVRWHPNPGELQQTCAYAKPRLSPPPRKLTAVKSQGRCQY